MDDLGVDVIKVEPNVYRIVNKHNLIYCSRNELIELQNMITKLLKESEENE